MRFYSGDSWGGSRWAFALIWIYNIIKLTITDMITELQKKKILQAILENRVNYPSDAKHAASLGISTSVYSALKNEAMLELKALWNATERCCAWYMMGADGLKAWIDRSIEMKMVGYTEMFSRYGDRYSKVTPDDGKEREAFLLRQATAVAKVNAPEGTDIGQIVRKTRGGLRRVYTEIEKLKTSCS